MQLAILGGYILNVTVSLWGWTKMPLFDEVCVDDSIAVLVAQADQARLAGKRELAVRFISRVYACYDHLEAKCVAETQFRVSTRFRRSQEAQKEVGK